MFPPPMFYPERISSCGTMALSILKAVNTSNTPRRRSTNKLTFFIGIIHPSMLYDQLITLRMPILRLVVKTFLHVHNFPESALIV